MRRFVKMFFYGTQKAKMPRTDAVALQYILIRTCNIVLEFVSGLI